MGICACSAGNHAQGVAFSAAALDISVSLARWVILVGEAVELLGVEGGRPQVIKTCPCLHCMTLLIVFLLMFQLMSNCRCVHSMCLPGKDLHAADHAKHQGGRSAQALGTQEDSTVLSVYVSIVVT